MEKVYAFIFVLIVASVLIGIILGIFDERR